MLKRLFKLSSLIIFGIVLTGALNLGGAKAAVLRWRVTMSTPASPTNQHNFNLAYNVASTESGDTFTVKAFRNGVEFDSESINTPYGDSGNFALSLPDGTYNFQVKATNHQAGETKSSPTVAVTIDSDVPSPPNFNGKSRSGNNWTVSFTTANDGQTSQIIIYASTSSSFVANSASQVGMVDIGPGQAGSFTYNAPDSGERFFAVQANDGTGNFSSLATESGVSATPGQAGGGTGVPGAPGGQGTEGDSGTTGEEAQPDIDGQADQGEVAAEVTDRGVNPVFLIVIVAALAAIYLLQRYSPAVNRFLAAIRRRFWG